ncbi:hypothetical protein HQ576_07405 [bacterium]|nr:hypothetical protein [bacterium]
MGTAKTLGVVVLPVICCLCGCSPLDDPFWNYRMGQLDRYRAEIRRQYAADVAAHAAREEHLGTWDRRERLPTKSCRWKRQALALFRDGSYVHRTAIHRDFLSPPPALVTGEWRKTGPGQIKLTVTGKWREEPRGKAKLVPPPTAETQTIDLKEWTNVFVEANADLMSKADADARARPADARPD